MNFKFDELSKVLFNQDGWKALMVYFVYQMVIGAVAIVSVIFFALGGLFALEETGTEFTGDFATMGIGLLIVGLVLIVSVFVTPLFTAGLVASIEKIRLGNGYTFTLNDYFAEGKDRYGKTLGYSFLYVVFAVVIMVAGSILIVLLGDPEIASVLGNIFLLIIVFIVMLFSPIVYIASLTGSPFQLLGQLYKKYAGQLIILLLVVTVTSAIPLISMISSIFMIAYPVYLVVLLVDEAPIDEIEEQFDEKQPEVDSIRIEKE